VFAVKGSRYVTHLLRLRGVERPLANFFASGVLGLRDKLGPLLWQLPPMLAYDRGRLEGFFALLPRSAAEALALARRRDARMSGRARLAIDADRPVRHAVEVRLDLADIVRQTVHSMELIVAARAQELTLSVVPEGPLYVEADPTRMEQVFGNLLNNASKFSSERARIWVTVELERDEGPITADSVVVRIRDDGLGIDPEVLPHVFDLFAQADHSLARPRGDLGIGLTIVRRVVEQHGGRVEARSAGLGHGSEFLVHLPHVRNADLRATGEALASQTPVDVAAVRRRILVVEDSPDAADTLAKLLRVNGHEVRTEVDGPNALEAVGTFQPDIILLDIGLPGMNGYEVATQLRKLPGMDSALLIALTGYGQERDRDRSRQAGFDHHLTKPVDHPTLLRLLRSPERGG
jgi:two-component system, chemotaxis family, CheB/CheR fusion protein